MELCPVSVIHYSGLSNWILELFPDVFALIEIMFQFQLLNRLP
jgi:hypothetical protein